jgi:hypothetical protein
MFILTLRDDQAHARKIPKIVHFVTGLSNNPDFGMMSYLAVKAAKEKIQPHRILIHFWRIPQGIFWDWAVSLGVELHPIASDVTEVFGRPVVHYAHKADVIRMKVLLQHGGIYMDLDVIALRSFDTLLNHNFVMGQEGEGGSVGLCNAVMLASKGSRFLHKWWNEYRDFNGSQWNYHSVVLPNKLAKAAAPEDITVLPVRNFFWPSWDPAGLELIYNSFQYSYHDNYAIHTWSTVSKKYLAQMSLQWVTYPHSSLFRMLQGYIPHPIFSVVIPCYNQSQFIQQAVKSVLSQKFTSWEIIIVDDGSPDKCGKFVIKNMLDHVKSEVPHNRFHVIINSTPQGLPEARNIGIRASQGHWICALDADDLISPNYFSHAQTAFVQTPTAQLIYADQKYFGQTKATWQVDMFNTTKPLCGGPLPVMSLFRKRVWEQVGGYSSALPWGNEDYDFWLRVFAMGVASVKLPMIGSAYRVKTSSMMRDTIAYRDEELSMLRTKHPHQFGAAILLHDHVKIINMHSATFTKLVEKLKGNLSNTDLQWVSFWRALALLSKQPDTAYHELNTIQSENHGLKWQVLYHIGSILCDRHPKQGLRFLESASEQRPDLKSTAVFGHVRQQCISRMSLA